MKMVRISEAVKADLVKVAERDGFTVTQALDIILRDALYDLLVGNHRLGSSVIDLETQPGIDRPGHVKRTDVKQRSESPTGETGGTGRTQAATNHGP